MPKTKKPFISIIIPVYKTEKYLRFCLDSVVKQLYHNIEVILVDDKSPDLCPAICDEYAEKYDFIRVIHKENEGVGAARNTGVLSAKGDYVMFIDSDDALSDNKAVGSLASMAQSSGADIITGNFRQISDEKLFPIKKHGLKNIDNRASAKFRFVGFYSSGHLSYVWGKLYLREFIISNKIESPKCKFTQDKLFNMYCYAKDASYAFIDDCVYLYRINTESTTFKYKENYGQGWLEIARMYLDYIKPLNIACDTFDLPAYHILFGALFVAKQEYMYTKKLSRTKKVLAEYGNDALVPKAMVYIMRSDIDAIADGTLKKEIKIMSYCFSKKHYLLLTLGICILIKMKKL